MPLQIFNTLSGKVEPFEPQQAKLVRMYWCGPTVYDYGHIGNFRTFVAVDILRRFLRQGGYRLDDVMNITDVDDKIIRNAAKLGLTVRQYAEKYEKAFLEDSEILSLQPPGRLVRATEHIERMAEFIRDLEQKDYAYRTEDGSYYFRIARFPGYGKLSKKDFAGIEPGARVDVDEYEKDNARDFALWKSPKPGEAQWQTCIGPGRPVCHIEFSVIALEYLGDTLDLHGGGEDLIFPHHENEIAQSESHSGKPFARYWFHVRFLLVEGEKMSKSLGNFYTLRDLIARGHKPSSIRYLLASVPYRRQLNFTLDGLKQAAASVERLRNFRQRLEAGRFPAGAQPAIAALADETATRMCAAMEDDLNTAEALGAVFEMIRQVNAAADLGRVGQGNVPKLLEVLSRFDEIFDVISDHDPEKLQLALDSMRADGQQLPHDLAGPPSKRMSDEEIERLLAERARAKQARDFARADAIRKQFAEGGVILEDTKDGVRWRRK